MNKLYRYRFCLNNDWKEERGIVWAKDVDEAMSKFGPKIFSLLIEELYWYEYPFYLITRKVKK